MYFIPRGTKVKKKVNDQMYEGVVLASYQTMEGVWQVVVQCGTHTTFVSHPEQVEILNQNKVETKVLPPISKEGKL